jgi:hypothetical protein
MADSPSRSRARSRAPHATRVASEDDQSPEVSPESTTELRRVQEATAASRRETTDAGVIRGMPTHWFVGGPSMGELR